MSNGVKYVDANDNDHDADDDVNYEDDVDDINDEASSKNRDIT